MDHQSVMLQEFLLESFDNLSNIAQELTALEKAPDNKELLNQVYRSIHTLKGSASFLGFNHLQKLTHAMENVLDSLREEAMSINSSLADTLLASSDKCVEFLKNIEATGKEGQVDYLHLLQDLQALLDLNSECEVLDAPLINNYFSFPLEKEAQNLSEESSVEESQGQSEKRKTQVVRYNRSTSQQDVCEGSQVKSNVVDSVVKVNVNLLDKIMNVVGELVLNRNQIVQYASLQQSAELVRLTQQLNLITSELQSDIMTTRMQPIGSILTKFERLIRDFSKEHGKKINLKITGQDTELDKTLIEAIRDPLTHIIRNAADHGLEASQERVKKGKEAHGTIFIKSYHESGQVTVEVADDGRGLNPEKLLGKAIEKELINAQEAKNLSQEQIYELIFHPGFSTAQQVTNISGRGVGMDVVKTNIEKIGGSINIHSRVGEGTSFKMKIPLTLAIIPALIVASDDEFFAIAQINLIELVRAEKNDHEKIEKIYDSYFFRLRGELIPIFCVKESLQISAMKEECRRYDGAYDLDNDQKKDDDLGDNLNIVIVNAEGKIFGIVVDEILDTQEIVVKPLGKNLKDLNHFAGATIMGSGKVALIIDTNGFYHMVAPKDLKNIKKKKEYAEDEVALEYTEESENLLFYLADKSLFALPLAWVNRLEEIERSNIEYVGEQPVVRYRGKVMPLLDIESLLGLEADSVIVGDRASVSCIVLSLKGRDFGLVVDSIQDIAKTYNEVDDRVKDRKGILGTLFIENKTVTVLDIYELLALTNLAEDLLTVNELYKGRKILVVEDSPMYRKMEEELLIDLGFNVKTAVDGKNALEMIEQESFDLIVTDIEMPNLDGFELAKALRTHEKFQQVPIIAVSTKVSTKDRDKGKQSGFSRHLEKFKKEEIVTAVDECLKEAS